MACGVAARSIHFRSLPFRLIMGMIAASDALSVAKSEADRTVCPTSIAKGSIQIHDPANLMSPGRALRHLDTAHATKSREKGTENDRLQEGSWRGTRHARPRTTHPITSADPSLPPWYPPPSVRITAHRPNNVYLSGV